MTRLTAAKISHLIEGMSIAAWRSWLKEQGLEHSAGSKDQLIDRLLNLLKKGKLSDAELDSGVISIEEASSKRIALLQLPNDRKHLETAKDFEERLDRIGKKLSNKQERAPRLPGHPTLVYVTHVTRSPAKIRAKWAETQTKVEADYVTREFLDKKVTKTIIMVADIGTGLVQVRYDKPEWQLPHKNREEYFKYYRDAAVELLGVDLAKFEIREALRSLVETEPRIVRIRVNLHRSKTDKSVRFVDRAGDGDVRDDPEWKAASEAGEKTRVYEDQAVYWLPETSNGVLSREVFTDIDAESSMIRVEADCHESEIQYAVSTIRAHQIKASAPQSTN